jgi:hypothetical protein
MWSYIKTKLKEYDRHPSNKDQLWTRIQTIWDNIPNELVKASVHSMPNRVKEVIEKEGWSTMYCMEAAQLRISGTGEVSSSTFKNLGKVVKIVIKANFRLFRLSNL